MSYIENGRSVIAEREKRNRLAENIFTMAIDILEAKGSLVKNHRLLFDSNKYRIFTYTDALREPLVHVVIVAGQNLKRAERVLVSIEGVGILSIERGKVWGESKFEAGLLKGELGSADGNLENLDYSDSKQAIDGDRSIPINVIEGYINTVSRFIKK